MTVSTQPAHKSSPTAAPHDLDAEAFRKTLEDFKRFGMGNHSPESDHHNPLEAYSMSQTTSAPIAQFARWFEFFRNELIERRHFALMSESERSLFESLPENVTVYRGIRTRRLVPDHPAFSWTLSRSVAEWFAHHRGDRNGRPFVLEKVIPKSCIVWVLLEREEQEVVVCL